MGKRLLTSTATANEAVYRGDVDDPTTVASREQLLFEHLSSGVFAAQEYRLCING